MTGYYLSRITFEPVAELSRSFNRVLYAKGDRLWERIHRRIQAGGCSDCANEWPDAKAASCRFCKI